MLKKIAALIAFAMTVQGVAFAGTWPTNASYKSSSKVTVDYFTDTAKQNFTINSKHDAGNRVYSTSNNSSNIYYKEDNTWKGKSLATSAASVSTVGESTYSGWTTQ